MISTLHNGRFSSVVKCADSNTDELVIAKIFYKDTNSTSVQTEFDTLRVLR